ncbi:UNVERIFIED_CONTAM: Alpha-N-acetylglucosaminidase [Sesamum latifolium]|uniref:Alpha-N-acetylglucosaminidase n=1 Tax=Sesamum latifolium TaxID=2727402 RepID=A0AAW2UXS9_9LAMI
MIQNIFSSLAAAIFRGMESGDDKAVWLMQALLHSVPVGKLVVLDLYAEVKPVWATSEQFYGVPYIWLVLGCQWKASSRILSFMILCLKWHFGRTELTSRTKTEMLLWHSQMLILIRFLLHLCCHYRETIATLITKVQGELFINKQAIPTHPHLWYSTSEVIRALQLFIASGDQLSESNTFSYDLVDLTRQALAKYANQLFVKVVEAYQLGDLHAVTHRSQKFLSLVEDLDTLLACHDGFLLGPWLESAKQLAQNDEQKKQFEWNARTQITMWFDNTEEEASLLRDYGNKYWSGLLRDYYGPRAAIYFKFLIQSLERSDGFRLRQWRREWVKLTNEWQNGSNIFPTKSAGDALNVSRRLYKKYLEEPDSHDF